MVPLSGDDPDLPARETGDLTNVVYRDKISGEDRDRTDDLKLAKLLLYRLSYFPLG
jgi:hypothetical protein